MNGQDLRRESLQSTRDIELSDSEFDRIRGLIREITGITMGDTKRQLILGRVTMRLRALKMTSVSDYLSFLVSGDAEEVEQFTNAVTTNLTSFFRENHHFDYLAKTVIPEIVTKKASGDRRLRIWSAGCSTGEEPYSLAIALKESTANLIDWDAKILCTDIDTDVLARAKAGVYPKKRFDGMSEGRLKKWFAKEGENYRARSSLQEKLTFKPLNLMGDWPMRGKFDVIFCRNVIIYFDKPTQRVLMDRYANALEEGGHLFVGHSESLINVSDRFKLIGKTIYQKKY